MRYDNDCLARDQQRPSTRMSHGHGGWPAAAPAASTQCGKFGDDLIRRCSAMAQNLSLDVRTNTAGPLILRQRPANISAVPAEFVVLTSAVDTRRLLV